MTVRVELTCAGFMSDETRERMTVQEAAALVGAVATSCSLSRGVGKSWPHAVFALTVCKKRYNCGDLSQFSLQLFLSWP